jgi:predicted nucleic acid-binding protein
MARSGKADYLVTGDKSGLLVLEKYHNTQIVTAAAFRKSLG